jgi:pimeloyl-ACP methyl ester carboxylesterase
VERPASTSPNRKTAANRLPATFALIHGAGDTGWYWHLVEAELRARGHDVVAPDLPSEDESAGLWEYADAVVDALGERREVVVVAQSFGAFTAPLVCERVPVELLVLVAGMVPAPGEPPRDWWGNTGYESQAADDGGDDVIATYYHDVPPALVSEALRRTRGQSATPTEQPWPLKAWPSVPTRFLLCLDDRLFTPDFLRRVVGERLGIAADEIDGGHCVALSRPKELAARLAAYRAALIGSSS